MEYKEHCKELAYQLSVCEIAILNLLEIIDNKASISNNLNQTEIDAINDIEKMCKEITPLIIKK